MNYVNVMHYVMNKITYCKRSEASLNKHDTRRFKHDNYSCSLNFTESMFLTDVGKQFYGRQCLRKFVLMTQLHTDFCKL